MAQRNRSTEVEASPGVVGLRVLADGRSVVIRVDARDGAVLDSGLMARIVALYSDLIVEGARSVSFDAPASLTAGLASIGFTSLTSPPQVRRSFNPFALARAMVNP
jgi:hypothetical protein